MHLSATPLASNPRRSPSTATGFHSQAWTVPAWPWTSKGSVKYPMPAKRTKTCYMATHTHTHNIFQRHTSAKLHSAKKEQRNTLLLWLETKKNLQYVLPKCHVDQRSTSEVSWNSSLLNISIHLNNHIYILHTCIIHTTIAVFYQLANSTFVHTMIHFFSNTICA